MILGQFNINNTFKRTQTFLQTVYVQDKNEAILEVILKTLPALKSTIGQKGCPITL